MHLGFGTVPRGMSKLRGESSLPEDIGRSGLLGAIHVNKHRKNKAEGGRYGVLSK